ncbi:cupin domain-containing protein [Paenisporosarcina antarctica]|uniref:Cupin domain-containing protein n=1 Tax=Paenisporosarcina antarctica TaxID=417367 RepID=A0A4P6ZV41_9BACL|nr:cupin domain-containing protein [Paenisporosarcina antarctica]QBP40272.1 cupin domain-containing protein [Paenisporosarcina antarctica]
MEKQSLQKYQEFSEDRFTKRIIFKKSSSTAFVLNFLPDQQLPSHTHPGSDVFIMTVEGTGVFTIDGKEVNVMKNDLVHCSDQEQLSFNNNGTERVSLYVILNKIPNDKYAENS